MTFILSIEWKHGKEKFYLSENFIEATFPINKMIYEKGEIGKF